MESPTSCRTTHRWRWGPAKVGLLEAIGSLCTVLQPRLSRHALWVEAYAAAHPPVAVIDPEHCRDDGPDAGGGGDQRYPGAPPRWPGGRWRQDRTTRIFATPGFIGCIDGTIIGVWLAMTTTGRCAASWAGACLPGCSTRSPSRCTEALRAHPSSAAAAWRNNRGGMRADCPRPCARPARIRIQIPCLRNGPPQGRGQSARIPPALLRQAQRRRWIERAGPQCNRDGDLVEQPGRQAAAHDAAHRPVVVIAQPRRR